MAIFSVRITNIDDKGEMGQLMHAINQMIDRSDAYIRESKACLDYVSRNQHFRLIAEKGMVGDFKRAAESINRATWKIKQRHDQFDEMGTRFEHELDHIVESMTGMISNLQGASKKVSTASHGAQEQSLIVASGAEQASANMQSVSEAVEQLTDAIAEINSQVVNSSSIARQSVEKSHDMSGEISSLATASQQISEVVSLISDIAAQTNLLALNATIEAARAGEAGKGFAIVAQEVKNLSAQTAEATEQISGQISGLQQATERAVRANDDISKTIERVSEISTAIAAAVEQQSASTREISFKHRRSRGRHAGCQPWCFRGQGSNDDYGRNRQGSAGSFRKSGSTGRQSGQLTRRTGSLHGGSAQGGVNHPVTICMDRKKAAPYREPPLYFESCSS